jgi:peptidoglycan hydrolase-like protein with peptidoglycan-binding domain
VTPGSYAILIIDGTGNTLVVDLEIQAIESTVSEKKKDIEPEGPKKPAPTAPEPPLIPEQKMAIQRKLCVQVDGDFGTATRRAIREYQASVGLKQTGMLDKLQADAILGLPNCLEQPNFMTFYELILFAPERDPGKAAERIKQWQQGFNKASEDHIIRLDTPLELTGILDFPTRSALTQLQLQAGVRPADGKFSLKTLTEVRKLLMRRPGPANP